MVEIKKIKSREEFEQVLDLDLKLLEFEAFYDSGLKMPDEEIKKYEKDFFETKFKDKNNGEIIFVIAKDNKKVIGYGLGWIEKLDLNHKINREGYLCNVYVLDEYRKKRLGQGITNSMIEWFKLKGIKRIVLDITEKNKSGLKFWKRYGFQNHPFKRMCKDI